MIPPILKGAVAGLAGTAVLQLLSAAQRQEPIYAPERIAGRLVERYLRRPLPGPERNTVGRFLRWTYGPSLGSAFGEAEQMTQLPYPLSGLCLGAAVWAFELVALPLTGATPPLRTWGLRTILGDGLQALLFGIATASAHTLMEPT
jgi:hypothetical protein